MNLGQKVAIGGLFSKLNGIQNETNTRENALTPLLRQ